MSPTELNDLLTIYTSEVSDWHLQLCHHVSVKKYRQAADAAQKQMTALNKVAGALSQLLPLVPDPSIEEATEAVKTSITRKDSQ